jgi:hypothetical protein
MNHFCSTLHGVSWVQVLSFLGVGLMIYLFGGGDSILWEEDCWEGVRSEDAGRVAGYEK